VRREYLVSIQLPDDSWANFRTTVSTPFSADSLHVLASTTLMAVGIVLVSIVCVRLVTAPLRTLARAAERVGVDVDTPAIPETGPREVRQAAKAFNEMQGRLRKLIADRTQTLAAVSHDLRTPITRLRLRAEFVDDPAQRTKFLADLDDMEAMVASTLAFLRGDVDREEPRLVDIASLLATICDDMGDAGHSVRLETREPAPLYCRSLALKRAFANLIGNAVKYGGRAEVSIHTGPTAVTVTIDDDGPGIPECERERVFEPFYRLETSRSRQTGGTGLGLTVAQTSIRAHGGSLALSDSPSGGLRATVVLPVPAPPGPQP
jgi:signal transduction histidine kinase